MPIYEYRCQSCGHELEKLQRMSDPVLTDCPDCGKSELRRLISAAGFRLKGGGWYETDFKQGNKRNLADSGEGPPSDAKGEGKGEGKSDGKSDGKTDGKTDAKTEGASSSGKKSAGDKESGKPAKSKSQSGAADAA